jgi:hypothetical protein
VAMYSMGSKAGTCLATHYKLAGSVSPIVLLQSRADDRSQATRGWSGWSPHPAMAMKGKLRTGFDSEAGR